MLKSNQTHSRQNLAPKFTPRRAEELLQFWANLADLNADEFGRELESLTEFAPEVFGELRGLVKPADDMEEPRDDFFRSVWGLREHLRAAWQTTDLRAREWYIHELRRLYVRHTELGSQPDWDAVRDALLKKFVPEGSQSQSTDSPDFEEIFRGFRRQSRFWGFWVERPPALTAFERVMFHFQRVAHRARKCENPECTAPYFFTKRKGQKYCTEECALPAQRKAKSEWWARNREDQMKRRKRKRKAIKTERRESKNTIKPSSIGKPRKVARPPKKRETQ